MNICFLTENYYRGGLDTFIVNLINSWPDKSDNITLVCNVSHAGLINIESRLNTPVFIKKYSYLFTSKMAQFGELKNGGHSSLVQKLFAMAYRLLQYPVLFPLYIFASYICFKKSSYDRLMVINGGYPGSLLGRASIIGWRLSGKPKLGILNFHNSTIAPPWYYAIFEYIIDRLIIGSANCLISVSENSTTSLKIRPAFADYDKNYYIYNGISKPMVSKGNFPGVGDDEKYCLMLATYEKRKGHSFLLEAFTYVLKSKPTIKLHIYGHGSPDEVAGVISEIEKLGLAGNVTCHDFVSDPTPLLSRASVLVVPSQEHESFGLTIIEAMSLGIPVVATNIGGIPEVFGDSRIGILCQKDDPRGFGDAIVRILNDEALAAELGHNGINAFQERFSAEAMSLAYREILR